MTSDGVAYSVMVGMGESALAPFALAVGLGEVAAGLIVTIPQLIGGLLQLLSPWAVVRLGSLRRWVVLTVALQGLSFVPLLIAALRGEIATVAAFLVVSVYWGAGQAAGAAWNTWAGALVPLPIRARYFAHRTRMLQVGTIGGLLLAGWLLDLRDDERNPATMFAVVFAIAGLARLSSAAFLARQSEPAELPRQHRALSWRELLQRYRHGSNARLLTYMLAVQVAALTAGPFLSPYMLGQLRLDYTRYMVLVSMPVIAKALTLSFFGLLAKRFRTETLLWIGGIAIVPVSALWYFSDDFAYLLLLQALAGTAWAAYELATFLMIVQSIPRSERTSMLTLYNFANAAATSLGSLIGGQVLHALGAAVPAYLSLFVLSSVLRAATLLLLVRVPGVLRRPASPLPPPVTTDALVTTEVIVETESPRT